MIAGISRKGVGPLCEVAAVGKPREFRASSNPEVIQTFDFLRIAPVIHIWRGGKKLLHPYAFILKNRIELSCELRVRIVDNVRRFVLFFGEFHADVPGLLSHPGGIRMGRRRGDPNARASNMDEDQQVHN